MSPNQYSPKSGTEKLRTSCDSCHLSKVKCSKSRPLCSRCLICGTDCTYSPSARVGRKSKSEANSSKKGENSPMQHTANTTSTPIDDQTQFQTPSSNLYTTFPYSNEEMTSQQLNHGGDYSMATPSTSGFITPAQSDAMDSLLFMEAQTASEGWIENTTTFDYLPWTADALDPSFTSPDMLSAPTVSWGTLYDTDLDPALYINPAYFQYPQDPTTFNPNHPYGYQSSANV